jgi:hypothetical protein
MGKVSEYLYKVVEAIVIVFKQYNYKNGKPTYRMTDMDMFINKYFGEIYDNINTKYSEGFVKGFYDDNKEYIISEVMAELTEGEKELRNNESLKMPSLKEYIKYPGKNKFDLDEDSIEDKIRREREFNKKPRYAGGYSTPPPAKDYKSSVKPRYDFSERKFISQNIKGKQDILNLMGYDLETGEEDPSKAPTPRELSKIKTTAKRLEHKRKPTYTEKKEYKNFRNFLTKFDEKRIGDFNKLKNDFNKKEKEMTKFTKKHKKESILDNMNERYEVNDPDYSELEWNMDKYMPEDIELQNEYYDILNDETLKPIKKIAKLMAFFDDNADEEIMNRYMPKLGDLIGFCAYLIDYSLDESNKNQIKMPALNEWEENKDALRYDDKLTISLTKTEARELLNCLIRTNAKGDDLTFGMKLEDILVKFINNKS